MLGTRSGGLNMINIGLFIKSLKATWLRRYLTQNKPPWKICFKTTICCDLEKSLTVGPEYLKSIKKRLPTNFGWTPSMHGTVY